MASINLGNAIFQNLWKVININIVKNWFFQVICGPRCIKIKMYKTYTSTTYNELKLIDLTISPENNKPKRFNVTYTSIGCNMCLFYNFSNSQNMFVLLFFLKFFFFFIIATSFCYDILKRKNRVLTFFHNFF